MPLTFAITEFQTRRTDRYRLPATTTSLPAPPVARPSRGEPQRTDPPASQPIRAGRMDREWGRLGLGSRASARGAAMSDDRTTAVKVLDKPGNLGCYPGFVRASNAVCG